MVSKKKRFSPKLRQIFRPISQIQTFEGGLFSYGGGYFQFFTKNRPQKHKKHAILHTSQANGGGSSPPRPPPPLATLLHIVHTCRKVGLAATHANVWLLHHYSGYRLGSYTVSLGRKYQRIPQPALQSTLQCRLCNAIHSDLKQFNFFF